MATTVPPHRGRRRPAVRWIVHGVVFVALVAGVFALLPRLGGLKHDAAGLRHARQAFLAAAIVAQGKAKESLRRHGLADSIPRLISTGRGIYPRAKHCSDYAEAAYPNADTNSPIVIGSWPVIASYGAVVFGTARIGIICHVQVGKALRSSCSACSRLPA